MDLINGLSVAILAQAILAQVIYFTSQGLSGLCSVAGIVLVSYESGRQLGGS